MWVQAHLHGSKYWQMIIGYLWSLSWRQREYRLHQKVKSTDQYYQPIWQIVLVNPRTTIKPHFLLFIILFYSQLCPKWNLKIWEGKCLSCISKLELSKRSIICIFNQTIKAVIVELFYFGFLFEGEPTLFFLSILGNCWGRWEIKGNKMKLCKFEVVFAPYCIGDFFFIYLLIFYSLIFWPLSFIFCFHLSID